MPKKMWDNIWMAPNNLGEDEGVKGSFTGVITLSGRGVSKIGKKGVSWYLIDPLKLKRTKNLEIWSVFFQ